MLRALSLTALWLLTLVCFAPLLVALSAGATASLLGCAVDEGASHPCSFGGAEIGPLLQTGVVAGGWLSLVAIPGMLLTTAIWAALLLRRPWRARRPPTG